MEIYSVRCKRNNRVYVGQTINSAERRWRSHVQRAALGSDGYFHRAIRKYGPQNFRLTVVKVCKNKKQLDKWERFYIRQLKANDKRYGYNLAVGGGGALGVKKSLKERRRIGAWAKELWKQPAFRTSQILRITKFSNEFWKSKKARKAAEKCMTAIWANPKSRKRQLLAIHKAWKNPKLKEKHKASMEIVRASPKYRKKLSEGKKKLYSNPEARLAMSLIKINFYRNNTLERKRQSARSKKLWKDPIWRAKMSVALRKGWALRRERLKGI